VVGAHPRISAAGGVASAFNKVAATLDAQRNSVDASHFAGTVSQHQPARRSGPPVQM